MDNLTREELISFFQSVRKTTEIICAPLEIEDYVIQSIDDVSPAKWHLAHTTWFFETFLLMPHETTYKPFDPLYHHLFNSYYQALGSPYPRVKRGVLSRPTVKMVYQYRHYVDEVMLQVLTHADDELLEKLRPLLILGLHHEQQHQELLFMDIKHNFYQSPDFPAYQKSYTSAKNLSSAMNMHEIAGGLIEIGHADQGFCFDNELPRNEVMLKPFLIGSRLVTNGEYAEFMAADGYRNPLFWLSDGWDAVIKNNWQAPLYWVRLSNDWRIFTLQGLRKLDEHEPVSHVSFYEADAYARFRGLRLPTESEWEYAAVHSAISKETGHFLESNELHPRATFSQNKDKPQQLFGDLWEWTSSPYCAYPGFKPVRGALGEYNGKFMSNQIVLRGGSCVTPSSHIRASYRNFFQPDKRWQFSGIRLASHS